MATNHTQNFELSQWLGTDSFARADFNSDNQKIDAGLKSLENGIAAVPFVLVSSVKLTQEARTMTLDLSGADLSKYLYLELAADIVMPSNRSLYHYLRLNGVSSNSYYKAGSETAVNYIMRVDLAEGSAGRRTVRFAPYEPGAKVGCGFMSWSGADAGMNIMYSGTVTWDNLTSINYDAASTTNCMQAGSGLYLFGVKRP